MPTTTILLTILLLARTLSLIKVFSRSNLSTPHMSEARAMSLYPICPHLGPLSLSEALGRCARHSQAGASLEEVQWEGCTHLPFRLNHDTGNSWDLLKAPKA